MSESERKRRFGATGKFPDGAISRSDEGELAFGVAYDPSHDLVLIKFGKPVAGLAMPPEEAIELAKVLLHKAGAKKTEVEL